ncbi:MAG: metallophosphoesterase [Parachlamydiales bacterium]
MKIWAIADLHLAVSCPDKDMAVFGPAWSGYMEKMAERWRERIGKEDLVLIPGDISWAMRPDEARADLEWIEALPGKKVIIRGNHDYWWTSIKKVREVLPPSIVALHHSAVRIGDVAIAGTRLWDSEEYRFDSLVQQVENPRERVDKPVVEDEKIFARELGRLEIALKAIDRKAPLKIVMVHYPPIGPDLAPSKVSRMLEGAGIDLCLFGHLHNLKTKGPLFGEARGVRYLLTSADYLDFTPLQVAG